MFCDHLQARQRAQTTLEKHPAQESYSVDDVLRPRAARTRPVYLPPRRDRPSLVLRQRPGCDVICELRGATTQRDLDNPIRPVLPPLEDGANVLKQDEQVV